MLLLVLNCRWLSSMFVVVVKPLPSVIISVCCTCLYIYMPPFLALMLTDTSLWNHFWLTRILVKTLWARIILRPTIDGQRSICFHSIGHRLHKHRHQHQQSHFYSLTNLIKILNFFLNNLFYTKRNIEEFFKTNRFNTILLVFLKAFK